MGSFLWGIKDLRSPLFLVLLRLVRPFLFNAQNLSQSIFNLVTSYILFVKGNLKVFFNLNFNLGFDRGVKKTLLQNDYRVLMASAYQPLTFVCFRKSMGIFGLGWLKICAHEIINNISFHLAINIVSNNSNFSFYFAIYWNHNVLMHHDIMYYVVFIMSPMIHMYFVI